MKRYIDVRIDKDHCYYCSNKIIARQNENNATAFRIQLLEEMLDKWIYIEFAKPNGEKISTPRLEIENGVAIYDVPNTLTDHEGELSVEIVIRDSDNSVWKSYEKTYLIDGAINASETIEEASPDFITEAQTLLDEINKGLTPTIGDNENWFICGKDTGKSSRGPEGKQGPKGEAGSVKFIVANKLPTSNIEWNGDITDKEVISELPEIGAIDGYYYYKVSDQIPTKEQLIGQTMDLSMYGSGVMDTTTITSENVFDYSSNGTVYGIGGADTPSVLVVTETTSDFPYSTGIYFVVVMEMMYVSMLTLPVTVDESAIYMIPVTEPQEENTYTEYIYVNGAWESLGTSKVEVNMEDYQKATELEEKIFEITYEDGTAETIRSVVYK